MAPELLAALVTSIASLAVAVLSLLVTTISRRKLSGANRELELLKHDLERNRSRDRFVDDRLAESLKSLGAALQSLQEMRDAVQLVVQASLDLSLDAKSAREALVSARDRLFCVHRQELPHVTEEERRLMHRAKNMAHSVVSTVYADLQTEVSLAALSATHRDKLVTLRCDLGEVQQRLRDCMSRRLAERISG